MNNIHLVGNVGRDPELRCTTSGTPVANLSLATNRIFRDSVGNKHQTTEWHRLVIWGEAATNLAKIVGKGDLIAVRGRLEYKPREIAGETVQDAVIRVMEWTKLSPRKRPVDAGAPAEETEPAAAAGGDDDGFQPDDDDIPF